MYAHSQQEGYGQGVTGHFSTNADLAMMKACPGHHQFQGLEDGRVKFMALGSLLMGIVGRVV